ncbi:MAG: class I SAM-dependent methyltransferase [Chthoniobacterales bacterium]
MTAYPLTELRARIEEELTAHPHLQAIRAYNCAMVGELGKACNLPGAKMLDLGASVHGYALEAALGQGVRAYEGIDLDIGRHWSVDAVEFARPGGGIGRLREMNAEGLEFENDTFDCLLSISTFEHFLRPKVVLAEMHRVLRGGGVALLSFEPVWTCAYGHHLHHFGAVSELVPPWSHLFLDEARMRGVLERSAWPADAPLTVEDALRWIFHESGINRLDLRQLRNICEESAFEVSWVCPLADEAEERRALADYVSRLTIYDPQELLTRGLSVLLRKQ